MSSSSSRIHRACCGTIVALALSLAVASIVLSPVKTVLGILAVLFCLHNIHNLTS